MKQIIIISILFLALPTWAQKIWLQAPSTQIPRGDQSYSEFLSSKYRSIPDNQRYSSWGQSLLARDDFDPSFFSQLDSFEEEGPISSNDRSFLVDVVGKLMNKPLSQEQKRQLKNLYCRWTLLDGHTEEGGSLFCSYEDIDLSLLKNKFPFAEKVIIEDRESDLNSQLQIPLQRKGIYHWHILSNSYKPISFRGSFDDLIALSLQPEKVIQGDCDSFTHSIDDLEVISRGWVYFNEACQKDLRRQDTSSASQWYEKNKSWVIPVGIAILGAAAYQLKDKKLVITKPH